MFKVAEALATIRTYLFSTEQNNAFMSDVKVLPMLFNFL